MQQSTKETKIDKDKVRVDFMHHEDFLTKLCNVEWSA